MNLSMAEVSVTDRTLACRYRSQLGSRSGGPACMWALGFKPIMEAGEEVRV